MKLYNGDINISDSIKQNRLIFSDEHEESDCVLTENEKLLIIEQKLYFSKVLIEEMLKILKIIIFLVVIFKKYVLLSKLLITI